MSDLNKMQKEVVAFRKARDWEQFHKPKDCAISLALEAAEVMELLQWKSSEEIKAYLSDGPKHEDMCDELADVLYWVLLLAEDFDVDLGAAWSHKMKKNDAKYPVEKAKGRHTKYTEL